MSVNVDDFIHPDGANGSHFTDQDWERAKAAVARIRERLAKRCRHLVKGEPRGPRRIDWEKINRAKAEYDEKLKAVERAALGDY